MRGFVAAFSMLAAVVGAGPAIHVPAPPSVVGGPVAGATAAGSHPGEEGDGRYPVYPSRTAGTQARVPATDKPAGAARSPRATGVDHGAWSGRDLPDPTAIYDNQRYHAFSTSSWDVCRPVHVPHMVAANASTPLAMMGDAMPKAPPWVATSYAGTCPPSLTWDIWAPSVLRIGGRYVLYFAGRNASTGMFCLGTATAPTLDQAFTAQPAPLYCNSRFWSIDPNPVTIGSSLYLVFRTDDAANLRGKIVSRRLRADGLAFYSSADPLITLLTGTESWEEGDPSAPGIGPIENPSMALLPATGALPGQWILTYSANNWATNDYATGLATCAGPAGPCTKVSKAAPWLNNSASPSVATGTSARFGGAGGFFLVTDSAGAPQGVFAAYADYHAAPTAPRQMFTYQLTRPGVNPSLTSAERVDVTMPAPTGVVAVAGVASAKVTWGPPSVPSDATGYVVTASPGPVTAFVPLAATAAVVPGLPPEVATTFTVATVTGKRTGVASASTPAVQPRKLSGVRLTLAADQPEYGFGSPVTLQGSISLDSDGSRMASAVLCWRTTATWAGCRDVVADSAGRFHTLVTPEVNTTYGAFEAATVTTGAAASPEVTVRTNDPVERRYDQLGGNASFLGAPLAPPVSMLGARQRDYAGGTILWSQQSGAHYVCGAIGARYRALGGPRSVLGLPTTDETRTSDMVGRFNHFQRGSIYWTASTAAHEVYGSIRAKWAQLGWERGLLGYPTTGELPTPDMVGRFNHFQHGSIYWTASTGAHELHGSIRAKWAQLGWERSLLGYPTSDEFAVPKGRRSNFRHGSITYIAATRQTVVLKSQ